MFNNFQSPEEVEKEVAKAMLPHIKSFLIKVGLLVVVIILLQTL